MADPQPSPQAGEQDERDTDNQPERQPTDDSDTENELDERYDFSSREHVLIRGMRILEAFADTVEPLKLSEIKRRSELPMTTTHRLVGALVEAGALEQVGPRRYQVGTRLIAVVSASRFPPGHPVSITTPSATQADNRKNQRP